MQRCFTGRITRNELLPATKMNRRTWWKYVSSPTGQRRVQFDGQVCFWIPAAWMDPNWHWALQANTADVGCGGSAMWERGQADRDLIQETALMQREGYCDTACLWTLSVEVVCV